MRRCPTCRGLGHAWRAPDRTCRTCDGEGVGDFNDEMRLPPLEGWALVLAWGGLLLVGGAVATRCLVWWFA